MHCNSVVLRRPRLALICDLRHDKILSDKMLNDMPKAKQPRSSPPEKHRAQQKLGSKAEVQAEIRREQEKIIEQLKKTALKVPQSHKEKPARNSASNDGAGKKKTRKKKRASNCKGSSTAEKQSTRAQTDEGNKQNLRWSNRTAFTSSSSSSDEDLATYEALNAQKKLTLPGTENGIEDQHLAREKAPSPVQQPDATKQISYSSERYLR